MDHLEKKKKTRKSNVLARKSKARKAAYFSSKSGYGPFLQRPTFPRHVISAAGGTLRPPPPRPRPEEKGLCVLLHPKESKDVRRAHAGEDGMEKG